jgi:DNA-binding phage protein
VKTLDCQCAQIHFASNTTIIKTMSVPKTIANLLPFDAARYLTDDAAIAEYMTAVLETDDLDLLQLAMDDVARALVVRHCAHLA